MKPCISQVTTALSTTFADDIAAYATAGWTAMDIWLTKLESHLAQHSVVETRKLLQDHGIAAAAASFQGGLFQSAGEQRRVHFDHLRRRLDMCQGVGIPTLVVAADFAGDVPTVEHVVATLREASNWAAGAEVSLALEFRAGSRFCNNLQTALALIDQTGEPNLGVNLDLFHFQTGPSKTEDLALLAPQKLKVVNICDLAGGPRELAADADRILPGDGDLDVVGMLRRLASIGYDGCVSLELMNPMLWRMKTAQVAEIGRMALERVLTEASSRPG